MSSRKQVERCKTYCVILAGMLVCDSHVAKIPTSSRWVVVASFNRGIIDSLSRHVAKDQAIDVGAARQAVLDVRCAADAGQSGSRSSGKTACKEEGLSHRSSYGLSES